MSQGEITEGTNYGRYALEESEAGIVRDNSFTTRLDIFTQEDIPNYISTARTLPSRLYNVYNTARYPHMTANERSLMDYNYTTPSRDSRFTVADETPGFSTDEKWPDPADYGEYKGPDGDLYGSEVTEYERVAADDVGFEYGEGYQPVEGDGFTASSSTGVNLAAQYKFTEGLERQRELGKQKTYDDYKSYVANSDDPLLHYGSQLGNEEFNKEYFNFMKPLRDTVDLFITQPAGVLLDTINAIFTSTPLGFIADAINGDKVGTAGENSWKKVGSDINRLGDSGKEYFTGNQRKNSGNYNQLPGREDRLPPKTLNPNPPTPPVGRPTITPTITPTQSSLSRPSIKLSQSNDITGIIKRRRRKKKLNIL